MTEPDPPRRGVPSLESYSRPGSGLLRFDARGMGTLQVLLLGGAPDEIVRRGAQEAFETFERLEQSLSKFLPSSDLSILNQLGSRRPVAVGGDLRFCLERAREAWEITGGAFDPTVGGLLAAWGLVGMEGKIPDAEDLEALVRSGGMGHVIVGARTAEFDRPGISVDLGGIAKGYAVDRVARDLRALGIPVGAVISGRSSILVWGAPPGEERWRFEVVHPTDPEEALAELRVEPGAVSSSAADERRFERGGIEYGHVIDPRTGRPARGVRAVTVWTETALLGDVLSTTLFVLGRDALAPGGAAERLVRLWRSGEGEPRASFLLALENPRRWGGIEVFRHAIGRPAFE